MFGFFAASAIFCLFYCVLINVYTGFKVSGSFIWLILSLIFAFLALVMKEYKLHPKKIALGLIVAINTLTFTAILIFIILQGFIASAAWIKAEPGLDYVIVLGAKVRSDKSLSKSLRYRVEQAMEYLVRYPSTYIVLSGGKGDDEPVSEAEAMAVYMVNHGINPDNLYLEIQSKNTRENMLYSKALIKRVIKLNKQENSGFLDERENKILFAEDKPKRIGITTNSYHLFRALALANADEANKIYGIPAKSDAVLYLHFSFRECFAILKDKFMGYF